MALEAVRATVHLIMAKEAVAGTVQIRHIGSLWGHLAIILVSFSHHFASEDKSKTAFLAPGASMVVSILMIFAPKRCAPGCGASGDSEYLKSLSPMGLVSPLKERSIVTVTRFLLGLRTRALCFTGTFSGGLPYPKRRQVVYAIQPDGGYIPKAFATILLTCCVLFTPMGSGCNPPTAFREVFAFDKRVSRCIAFRALSLWLP